MDRPPSFQSVILSLQRFWADRGCLIWQPYYTQVGAGTMNPATFLRVLGPEPWRVAYVEPSIRPDDGRFGENPNRLQQHYQFQVILKPDPGNPQEVYLDSLLALGIDPARHDVRFVEDRWEAPALGAWGLGWEVWLDGQEISQFTYFQQAGGQTLDPVSVEITYGLERILIGLHSLHHFRDIPWTETRTYGDLLLKAEEEHTRYYHEQADVDRLRRLYELSREEGLSALEQGLVLPAYDHLLRCSHTFNVLDSRGAVGVAERAVLFGQMRELTRRLAEAYLEQRREAGYPWLEKERSTTAPTAPADPAPGPTSAEGFVLEIGTEELPVGDLAAALRQLPDLAEELLKDFRLEHGEIRAFGTPRRLSLLIDGLAAEQPPLVERVKGPPEARAFDGAGQATPAALGWAGKFGLDSDPEALRALVAEVDGGRYLAAEIRRPGKPAGEVLAQDVLPLLVGRIGFDQTMRWIGTPDPEARRTTFARPIRWLLALHGKRVIPFSYAGLVAGRETRGLRFGSDGPAALGEASGYPGLMEGLGVIVDPAARRRRIADTGAALAAEVGGTLEDDPALLQEVGHLVEEPHTLRGAFDPEFLKLPEPVLTAVMKKHQRCFPVRSADRALLAHFVAVRNGPAESEAEIRSGNEHVLRARFADAAFFLARDRAQPLEHYRALLARLTFHTRLGSMLDKVERLVALAPLLAADTGLPADRRPTLERAAALSKADLATSLVTEMTSLQGVLGRIYALESGEPQAVAEAIYQHHLPRFGGDALPESAEGIALGLADRIDSLCGLFAAGEQPSGARDPLGMRRAAVGLVQILVARGLRVDLARWLEAAAAGLPVEASGASRQACLDFIVARLEALLLAEGRRHDVVAAVLTAQGNDPAGAAQAVAQLEAAVAAPDWAQTLQAYARCARIVRSQPGERTPVAELLEMDEERELDRALRAIRRPASVEELVGALRGLVPPVTGFFDKVLVMDEDAARRENRLALVQAVVDLAGGIADLSKLEGF